MTKTIAINGRSIEVLNTLHSGPSDAPIAYELKGGAYVYSVGQDWLMQVRGQVAQRVEVAR
jgi:hypothetical protein